MIHTRDRNKECHDALSIEAINVRGLHFPHIELYPVLLQDSCIILYFRVLFSIKTYVMQHFFGGCFDSAVPLL